jgi:hypothetical protein
MKHLYAKFSVWTARTKSLWCQRKWWTSSWVCASSVPPVSVSMNLDLSIWRTAAESQSHSCKSSTQLSSPVMTQDKEAAPSEAMWRTSSQRFTCCCYRSAVRNGLRPDACLHMDVEASSSTWLSEMVYTEFSVTICCCIALLQLLYTWQYLSQKLWIPHRPNGLFGQLTIYTFHVINQLPLFSLNL